MNLDREQIGSGQEKFRIDGERVQLFDRITHILRRAGFVADHTCRHPHAGNFFAIEIINRAIIDDLINRKLKFA